MKKKIISLLVCIMIMGLFSGLHVSALENKEWLATDASATIQNDTGEWNGIHIDATNGKFAPRESDIQINQNTCLSIPVDKNEAGAEIVLNLSGGTATVNVFEQSYPSNNGKITIPVSGNQTGKSVDIVFETQGYLKSIELIYLEEYPGIPGETEAKDTDYIFDGTISLKNAQLEDVEKLEGSKGTFGQILVDATQGKFAVDVNQKRVQVNKGTVIYVPVTVDPNGVSLMISGTQDGSTPIDLTVDEQSKKSNQKISLDIKETKYVKVVFEVNGYINSISIDYESDLGYGIPEVEAEDKVWDFSEASEIERPQVQGQKGEFDGIQINAAAGKFAPRDEDTQINAGTVLYIPVAQDSEIAVSINGNNYNNLTVTWDDQPITIGKEFVISNDEIRYIPLKFEGEGSCYLANIHIDYASDNVSVSHTVRVGNSQKAQYKTIQAALDNEVSDAAQPLIIDIEPGVYEEKLEINKANVTFRSLSEDPEDVVIKHHYYSSNTFDENGQFVPQDEFDKGTDQSGTIIVTSAGTNFTMYNITVENSYNIETKTGLNEQTPAVALCTNADKVYLNNCRIIGRQDTLYVKGTGNRVYIKDSYIEGTVDFIFGDADAYFDHCQLHMAYYNGKKNGYYTAPNTKEDGIGLVFAYCTLTADEQVKQVSLGRPWQNECYSETTVNENGDTVVVSYNPNRPRDGYENISSATTFYNCQMSSQIQNERWNKWTRKTVSGETVSVTFDETVRFSEYNSVDEQNQLLNPNDYEVVLGSMQNVENIDQKIETQLTQMRIGKGLGLWLPDLETYIPEKDPDQDEVISPDQDENTSDQNGEQETNQNTENKADSVSVSTSSVAHVSSDTETASDNDDLQSQDDTEMTYSDDVAAELDESQVPLSSAHDTKANIENETEDGTRTPIFMIIAASVCIIVVIGWFVYRKLIMKK